MANLPGILGAMLATGMAGRSRRGPAFGASPFGMTAGAGGAGGMDFRQKAGLAALGFLAYKGYQEYQRNRSAGQQPARDSEPGGSLGERLAAFLRPEQQAKPETAIGDQKALLLIRAMIAAANADGEISPEERDGIMARLQDAGAGAEDRSFVEAELAAPKSVDALLGDVNDAETAEQVYLASAMAIDPDTPAERSYLQYLAARLKLDPQRVQSLRLPNA